VGSAPPATYSIKGRQYVVIASTGNKLGKANEYGDAYVAFALPGFKVAGAFPDAHAKHADQWVVLSADQLALYSIMWP
jgi:hypothetical protein